MPRALPLREAVYATVAWFDVFDQPVSAEEVHRYLWRRKATLAAVKKQLYSDPRIGKSFSFFSLVGRTGQVVTRCRRQYHAGKLWRRVTRWRWLFRATPFLKYVAVGNTLAMGWPESDSDIDIFVVAKRNRLFTARFFLTLFTSLFRVRRHGDRIAGQFCLSFFVSESASDLSKLALGKEDPYLAFWTATLVPVWSDSAKDFYKANAWVKRYFPNLVWPDAKLINKHRGLCRRLRESVLSGSFGNFIEARLKNWQLRRTKNKYLISRIPEKTAVVTSSTVLKFHETDRRREFLAAWQKLLKAKPKQAAVKKRARKKKKL